MQRHKENEVRTVHFTMTMTNANNYYEPARERAKEKGRQMSAEQRRNEKWNEILWTEVLRVASHIYRWCFIMDFVCCMSFESGHVICERIVHTKQMKNLHNNEILFTNDQIECWLCTKHTEENSQLCTGENERGSKQCIHDARFVVRLH